MLRLVADVEQATPHEPFRLVEADGAYRMQALVREERCSLYRFDLQEQFQVDYEVSSYYLSTHPSSHFRHGLIAALAQPDRRHALRNRSYAVHHVDGDTERRVLETAAELRGVLEEVFGIALPDDPELDRVLDRLPR